MINHWIITGDTHGQTDTRLKNIKLRQDLDQSTGVIILGDSGINYYLNKTDEKWKRVLCNSYSCYIYLVRGNHEERPENLPNTKLIWDDNVKGEVLYEEEYHNIRYLLDGATYELTNEEQIYKTLVIGGAYSVDKYYRLAHNGAWFKDEQLTEKEQNNILFRIANEDYDLILTHTCPQTWEPRDLFLNFIDQSTVDKSMEKFLDRVADTVGSWKIWCFGHFHSDRIERPHVEQFFTDASPLGEIVERWKRFDETQELDWWLVKSSNFDVNDVNYTPF